MSYPMKKKKKLGAPARTAKKKSNYRQVGSVYEGEYGQYIAADDFAGELFFKDRKTDKVFKVKFINMFTPQERENVTLPENLVFNLAVNLDNEKAVEEIDLEE